MKIFLSPIFLYFSKRQQYMREPATPRVLRHIWPAPQLPPLYSIRFYDSFCPRRNAGVCGGTAKNHPESPGKNHVTYPRKAVPVITGYGLSTSLVKISVLQAFHVTTRFKPVFVTGINRLTKLGLTGLVLRKTPLWLVFCFASRCPPLVKSLETDRCYSY